MISMLGIGSFLLVCWDACQLGMVARPPDSPLLLFALWLSDVVAFLGLLWDVVVGVPLAKLMVSSRSRAAWFGAAVKSSFDMES